MTLRPLQTWFPFGSTPLALNLATYRNSPDRSTKSTRSYLFHSSPTVCKHRVSGSLSLPSRGPFHLSFTVLLHYRSLGSISPWGVVPPTSHRVSRVPWYSGSCPLHSASAYRAVTLSGRLSQSRSAGIMHTSWQSVTPACTHAGLGWPPFARRYSGVRVFFLFLRVLRCFSSPGSLPCAMDSHMDVWSVSIQVSLFRDPRLVGHLHLPEAYRSLSRLSSAPSAKASALRPFCLTVRPLP